MCIPSPAGTCAPLPKLLRASGYFSLPLCLPPCGSCPLVPLERLTEHRSNHIHPPLPKSLQGLRIVFVWLIKKKKPTRQFTGSEQKHTPRVWPGSWRIRSLPASFCATFPCLLCCQSLQLISEFSNKQYPFLRPHLFCPFPSWPG